MWILRLILILLGVAFVAGVYFYTRRHPPRAGRSETVRSEPSLTLQEASAKADVRTEPHVSVPGESTPPLHADNPEPQLEPESESHSDSGPGPEVPAAPTEAQPETLRESIFSLILRLPREGAEASRVLHQLERLGLVLNDQHIYHRIEPDGELVFSVANLFEPGTLHPLQPDALLQGLNFFFIGLPSAATSARFDRMLGTAYECANRFGGQLEDAQHRRLTAARELELKLSAAGARNG
ncbi:MAG: cell division protein ZipA C-terminal FtsZ-binding domain-containing protein [Gammaproteobacteria bacterium]